MPCTLHGRWIRNLNVTCKNVKIVEKYRPQRENITILITHDLLEKSWFRFANDTRDHTAVNATPVILKLL